MSVRTGCRPRFPKGLLPKFLLASIVVSTIVAFFPGNYFVRQGFLKPIRSLALRVLRSDTNIHWVMYTGYFIHVLETLVAIRACARTDLNFTNKVSWAALVLLVGYPALVELLKDCATLNSKKAEESCDRNRER
mmetsp:Transcript_5618/g.13633  ORF Transcript_5618/g.13633 Transcript_5618/m.13633 type:complete len:134 (+) Transcript_5618:292-693(+)